MSGTLVRDLIDAGIHFGHRVSRWNPKMGPYIYGKKNLIHIINVKETIKGLFRAKRFLAKIVSEGKDVLFVGTKRQAQSAVAAAAERTNMHFCNERWLGGTLTNYRTIRSRLGRLEELEFQDTNGWPGANSKKEESSLKREFRKIKRNLAGIRRMDRMPGVVVLIDPKREHICIQECQKLGIPTVCLIDTDSDPDQVDLPIPGNDDAMRAIEIVLKEIGDGIEEGRAARPVREESKEPRQARGGRQARPPMGPRGAGRGERGDRGDRGGDRGGSDKPTGKPEASGKPETPSAPPAAPSA